MLFFTAYMVLEVYIGFFIALFCFLGSIAIFINLFHPRWITTYFIFTTQLVNLIYLFIRFNEWYDLTLESPFPPERVTYFKFFLAPLVIISLGVCFAVYLLFKDDKNKLKNQF